MKKGFAIPLLFIAWMGQAQSYTPSPAELGRYKGEAANCTIIRDSWGIPHIFGKTDADAVFGLLYAECETDFPRVEKNYLEMLGRQAEAYGESFVFYDLEMRMIYDSAAARADYAASPPWLHKLLDAFADGVNYYLYKHPDTHPLVLHHFEPWYPLMFTDGSVSATSTGGIQLSEVKDFYTRGDPAQVEAAPAPTEPSETGSNGFALAGSRTASGNTMLYINPHVPFYFRLEVQLVSEEGLNAYGAVTWGQFFIYQGFNAHCGWMHTSSEADVADVYEEKMSRQGQQWVYEYEGKPHPVIDRPLTIRCKRGDSLATYHFSGYSTGHGAVLGSRHGRWLSLREYNRSMDALKEAWLITKANNFAEYKQAMSLRANTTNNTVYADDKGHIAYWHGNFMPRRDTAYNWALPVDGTTAATEWKGVHDLDEIVHVYDPSTGWIQNCNSTPFTSSGKASPDRHAYPTYMAPEGENFRALNAELLLNAAQDLTLAGLIAKGYDHYLTAFDRLLPALLDAYAGAPDSTKAALHDPIDVLRQWDRRSGERSVATTLAIEWATRMTRYAPRPATAEEATYVIPALEYELAHSTGADKLHELTAVITDLRQRFGDWKKEWGEVCRYQRLTGHINETYDDNRPSLAAGLVSSSFGALPSFQSRIMPGTKKRYGYSGNSFIAAVEFGPRLHAKTIVTGGESSDPNSPHFSDQAAMYLEGWFKDVYFYKDDLLKNSEKQYHPGEE
ncbi:MAG: penicillin acylase family protein [Bacteroidota bacterium]|nr:penicillin acylase family protein [Bacteroidota bacterium]